MLLGSVLVVLVVLVVVLLRSARRSLLRLVLMLLLLLLLVVVLLLSVLNAEARQQAYVVDVELYFANSVLPALPYKETYSPLCFRLEPR